MDRSGRSQRDSVSKAAFAAQPWRRRECFDEHAAIGFDHALRHEIARLSGELHVTESLRRRISQDVAECLSGISPLPLPRHDSVADVAKTIGRKRFGPGLPAEPDAATELSIPHPSAIA